CVPFASRPADRPYISKIRRIAAIPAMMDKMLLLTATGAIGKSSDSTKLLHPMTADPIQSRRRYRGWLLVFSSPFARQNRNNGADSLPSHRNHTGVIPPKNSPIWSTSISTSAIHLSDAALILFPPLFSNKKQPFHIACEKAASFFILAD